MLESDLHGFCAVNANHFAIKQNAFNKSKSALPVGSNSKVQSHMYIMYEMCRVVMSLRTTIFVQF